MRCSKLDSLFECPPSVLSDSVRVDVGDGEAAGLGKAVHEMMADYIETGTYDLVNVCARAGVADEEAAELMSNGTRLWDEIKQHFPSPQCEGQVSSKIEIGVQGVDGTIDIDGTLDVSCVIDRSTAIFADWKSGVTSGYANQMFGYAHGLWSLMGKPDDVKIVGIVGYLRQNIYHTTIYHAAMLSDWERDLTRNALTGKDSYHVGPHCRWCGIWSSCTARREQVRSFVHMLYGDSASFTASLDGLAESLIQVGGGEAVPPEAARLIESMLVQSKLVQSEIERLTDFLRAAIEKSGPVALPSGKTVRLKVLQTKTIDPLRATAVLRQFVSSDTIMSAARLSLPKLLDSYAKTHKPRERVAARDQLLNALVDAGAVTFNEQRRLEMQD